MKVNGEINRKMKDPEFNINKSKFYAVTPNEDMVKMKDEAAFYRGFTP